MSSDLSQPIDILRLAKSRERIEGSLQLDSFERLKDVLLENSDKLDYHLSFYVDESGTCVIQTEISGRLVLKCQRCLGPLAIEIKKNSNLGLVKDKDEADALDNKYEPLQLDENTISVLDMIEDELILSIPLAPLHEQKKCSSTEILERINADARPQPFAALAALKKK